MSLSKGYRVMATTAMIAGMLAFAGGCSNQNKDTSSGGTSQQKKSEASKSEGTSQQRKSSGTSQQKKAEPKPAPAAEAKPAPKAEAKPVAETKPAPKAEPAPAAAPSSGSGSGTSYRPAVPAGYNLTQAAFPTGDSRTSALMVSTLAPATTTAGKDYTYEVHATNLTNTTLQNVVVTQDSLQNLNVKASDPAAQRAANGNLVWNLGNIDAGKTKIIKVSGSASEANKAASGCFSATWNSSICMMTNVVQPALQITKANNPSGDLLVCDNLTYTITVKNTGSGAADNVKIADKLPAGMTLVNGAAEINDAIGTLKGGESATRTYQVKVSKPGAYSNQAQAMADGGLTATSNTVNNTFKKPAITLAGECPKDTRIGKGVTAKFTVRNSSDVACAGTTVRATLPNGASKITADGGGSAAGNVVSWNVGNLNAGESKTFTVNFTPGAGSNVINATANCGCAEAVNATCTFGVTGVPDIGTGVEDFVGVRTVGEEHEYEYVVKNQGQIDLTNVKMVLDLDAGLEYSRTTWTGGATAAGQKVTFNIGNLPVGQERKFRFFAKCTKAGDLIIRTVTTSDQTREVRNDEQVNVVE